MALGYLTIGTTDIERAEVFYREVLGILGAQKDSANSSQDQIWFLQGGIYPILVLKKQTRGGRNTHAGHTRLSLSAPNRSMVHNVHTVALDMGGSSEELPRFSKASGYSVTFSDLDSNKVEVFTLNAK